MEARPVRIQLNGPGSARPTLCSIWFGSRQCQCLNDPTAEVAADRDNAVKPDSSITQRGTNTLTHNKLPCLDGTSSTALKSTHTQPAVPVHTHHESPADRSVCLQQARLSPARWWSVCDAVVVCSLPPVQVDNAVGSGVNRSRDALAAEHTISCSRPVTRASTRQAIRAHSCAEHGSMLCRQPLHTSSIPLSSISSAPKSLQRDCLLRPH